MIMICVLISCCSSDGTRPDIKIFMAEAADEKMIDDRLSGFSHGLNDIGENKMNSYGPENANAGSCQRYRRI